MDVQYLKNPPHVFVIENFYTEDELNLMWNEFDSFHNKEFLTSSTGSARTIDYIPLKKSKGTWLDEKTNSNSQILKFSKKVKENHHLYSEYDREYSVLSDCVCSTLISYYGDGDYYKPHEDTTLFTACTYFFKEPKKFSGGNFLLNNYNIEIEIKNNMLIIFPGKYTHQARKVELKKEFKGYGRYCISQFFNIPVPEESEEKKND